MVCSNKEARKRLARRHSHNGPRTHECYFEVDVFVCWEWIEELEWLLLLEIVYDFGRAFSAGWVGVVFVVPEPIGPQLLHPNRYVVEVVLRVM